MKSRQKFTVSEKSSLNRSESEDYRLPRKKNSSNPLLQKNLNFLRSYNNLLRKPIFQQVGDANSYFKTTLRDESIDLIRDLRLDNQLVRTVRSFETINKKKFRSKYTLSSQSAQAEPRELTFPPICERQKEEFRELFTSRINKNSDSETESETKENLISSSKHLEPSKYFVKEELQIEDTSKTLDSILNAEQTTVKMAEETDIEDVEDILPEADEEEEGGTFTTDMETEDEEMKEVQKMIDDASEELQQVVKENERIIDHMDDEEKDAEESESVFKFDPTIDSAVLRELEDAERQAKETAAIITELRNRVGELLKKEKMTESEAKELEEKNKQLKTQMVLFEEKIKRIQLLIAQTNLFENISSVGPPLQTKHDEDILPKVIVCGLTENNIPKIIVCNDNKKPKKCSGKIPMSPTSPTSPRSQFTKKLNECYCMQEKLANENADLEGQRYQLQSDLINQDQTVNNLQKQLASLQTEMRMVCNENAMLNEKLQGTSVPYGGSPSSATKKGCGKNRNPCPADVVARLEEYSQNTQILERQLGDMEEEVRYMQKELIAVQKEREHLEHHRKMFCPPPCSPVPACLMSPCAAPSCAVPPCALPPCGDGNKAEQQLRELKEKYSRLQDDFKNKVTEVAGLRTDNEKLKDIAIAAEEVKKNAEDKIKELEVEMKKLKLMTKGSSKEQMIELEQQLNVAKQRFREAQDELEEVRALVEDQKEQMDDYRNKYLEAQQTVEEQRRHIDMMEMENQRVSEQVNLEIQRVKNQFQEKLQELMPLPDILKSTQLKLQEAQQMHLLAERNNEAIARELQMYKDKIAAMTNQMDEVRSDQQLGADEKATLMQKIEDLEKLVEEAEELNTSLKNQLEQMTEKADEFETLAEERLHEITQLESQLDSVRDESARQIARVKERCEIVRKSMQNQISDLERQMAQSKAIAKTAQKDRDEIRQKMQAQINNLNENFEDAQMRIKSLQGHVNFLKNTYGNVYPKEEAPKLPDPCNCGAEY